MSVEQLLIVFGLSLPLLHLLRSALKERQPGQSEERPARPDPVRQQPPVKPRFPPPLPPNVVPGPAQELPAPAIPDVPEVVAARRYLPADRIAHRNRGERRAPAGDTEMRTASERDASNKRELPEILRSPHAVRQALIAMTVFGPCRAAEPHHWEDPRAGGR